jgi:hypothetical protein
MTIILHSLTTYFLVKHQDNHHKNNNLVLKYTDYIDVNLHHSLHASVTTYYYHTYTTVLC